MLSSVNWFERGWKCFEGTFSKTGRNLTCDWQFEVPLLGRERFVDQLSYPGGAIDAFSLRSLSMPPWLRRVLQEEDRPVRVLGVSPPVSAPRVATRWAVLFDCANAVTPDGELFVLSRSPSLQAQVLATIRELVRQNGVRDFKTLGC